MLRSHLGEQAIASYSLKKDKRKQKISDFFFILDVALFCIMTL